jgi:ABC-type Fe3+ transport system substrate-binding protein
MKHAAAIVAAALALGAAPALALNPTPSTEKALSDLGLKPSVLDGLDKELAVPQAWLDGARKEGKARVRMIYTEEQFAKIGKAFIERYPGVQIEYTRAVGRDRSLSPLLAYRQGTIVTDVVSGFLPQEDEYIRAGALADLRDLPAFNSGLEKLRSATGTSVGFELIHWCMAYSTERLAKAELPKTWPDLLNSARLQGGKVGVANRPHIWLNNLLGVYGEEWADTYMAEFFTKLRPQLRKEAMSALMKLANLGEFDMVLPASPATVKRDASRGAKLAFHCPEPIPASHYPVGIFNGNPHPNASRLVLNWLISKEGQLVVHQAAGLPPAHKDFQTADFLPYPDAVLGKEIALQTREVLAATPAMMKKWTEMWVRYGGPEQALEDGQ